MRPPSPAVATGNLVRPAMVTECSAPASASSTDAEPEVARETQWRDVSIGNVRIYDPNRNRPGPCLPMDLAIDGPLRGGPFGSSKLASFSRRRVRATRFWLAGLSMAIIFHVYRSSRCSTTSTVGREARDRFHNSAGPSSLIASTASRYCGLMLEVT